MTQTPLALVTGANGNLGSAVVARLSSEGLKVAQVERSRVLLDGAGVGELDLADATSVKRVFAELTARGYELRAVVHTVGAFRFSGSLLHAPDADFVELFQTNVLTTVHLLQAALPIMLAQQRGRIAVVASSDAQLGRANVSAYAASKAAQLRVVESAAQELKGTGITLNAVLPTTMDTPQTRAAMPDADPKTWLSLAEVANVLAYLVSDAASGIHGQAIRVERG